MSERPWEIVNIRKFLIEALLLYSRKVFGLLEDIDLIRSETFQVQRTVLKVKCGTVRADLH